VLGYATEPAENGRARSQAQAAAIERACHRAQLQLVELVRDRDDGHGLDRPGLAYALLQIANGRAGGLVVSNLKQLAASAAELGTLLEWFHNEQAALIALDLRLDTRRPEGRATAQALIQVGAWERERSRPSARAALSAGRAVARPARRPAVRDHPQLAERIAAMREANMTLQQIADRLNAESVPTLRGGTKWRPSSVPTAAGYKRPGSQPAAAAIAQER
jgi:DNA invertase Pin-like site-specific DNA recombinase